MISKSLTIEAKTIVASYVASCDPRQILGPPLNACNFQGDARSNSPSLPIHLEGLKEEASFPQSEGSRPDCQSDHRT